MNSLDFPSDAVFGEPVLAAGGVPAFDRVGRMSAASDGFGFLDGGWEGFGLVSRGTRSLGGRAGVVTQTKAGCGCGGGCGGKANGLAFLDSGSSEVPADAWANMEGAGKCGCGGQCMPGSACGCAGCGHGAKDLNQNRRGSPAAEGEARPLAAISGGAERGRRSEGGAPSVIRLSPLDGTGHGPATRRLCTCWPTVEVTDDEWGLDERENPFCKDAYDVDVRFPLWKPGLCKYPCAGVLWHCHAVGTITLNVRKGWVYGGFERGCGQLAHSDFEIFQCGWAHGIGGNFRIYDTKQKCTEAEDPHADRPMMHRASCWVFWRAYCTSCVNE